jgi:asparagine synthase (glutamine-hydrolysing)
MRVLGLWGAPNHVWGQIFSSIEADEGDPAKFHRIVRPGAVALIRKGVPGVSFHEAFDGFAVVDGDVFEPQATERENAAAVVLGLFRRHGSEALDRIEGNAFIAVWDARSGRLILARDRFGMALGYWMQQGGAVLWSSDLTTLLRCDPRQELDPNAVDQFLADGRVSAPWTTLAHISKVPSAHYLRADSRGAVTRRYWRQDGRLRLQVSYPERLELLEQALLAAHRRQMSSGAPSAALLSGGVDSMLMVALLAKLGCNAQTFTYRYTHYDGKFNEGEPAARAARWLGLEHEEMAVGPEDISAHFGQILWQHQGPLTYGLHSAILSGIAGSAEVLFSGQGNGGASFTEQVGLALSRAPGLGRLLAKVDRLPLCKSGPMADLAYIGRVAQTRLSWRFHSPLTDPAIRGALYADPNALAAGVKAREELFEAVIAEFADQSAQNAFCASVQRLATSDSSLQWTTSFARAHGLLARCPYYDRGPIDLMYRLPRERDKRDLRDIAAKYLPGDLAFAPKIGQTIPIASWLRGPLAGWLVEQLDQERIRSSGMFRPEAVRLLVNAHLAGRGSHGWTLWSLAALIGWQELIRREAGRWTSRAATLSAVG